MNKLFTSESVTEGHPDKICDQISDAILDEILKDDLNARVACETAIKTGLVWVMGEITTNCYVEIQKVVRRTIREIGFTNAEYGLDADTCGIISSIEEQSSDIALGVNNSLEEKRGQDKNLGAGDQGMMFGYACDETEELMPLPIMLAHALTKRLSYVRKQNILGYLRPDGKSQVTVEYDEYGVPLRVHTIVLSAQHSESVTISQLHADLIKHVIKEVVPAKLIDDDTIILINPTGRFVIGGPQGDSGLTGRKIIVDTYGGYARHGGGSFAGKDPTEVDRSATYAARYVAKNIVAANLAKSCEIEVAYAIGVANPVSIFVNTFGTGVVPDDRIAKAITEAFDWRPQAIIESLDLRRPIYRQIASYGHFGRKELDLPWEKTDLVNKIKKRIY